MESLQAAGLIHSNSRFCWMPDKEKQDKRQEDKREMQTELLKMEVALYVSSVQ